MDQVSCDGVVELEASVMDPKPTRETPNVATLSINPQPTPSPGLRGFAEEPDHIAKLTLARVVQVEAIIVKWIIF